MRTDIFWVKRGSEEWNYMWKKLAALPLNKNQKNPTVCACEGECWQYMDTAIYDNEMKHSFRHRLHPATRARENVFIPVSSNARLSIV